MNRRNSWLALFAGVLPLVVGCERFMGAKVVGSGVAATLNYTVNDPYTELEITGMLEVSAAVGDKTALTITADDNILPLIKAEVRGSRLVIELKERVKAVTPVRVILTTLPVSKAVCAGAVTLRLEEINAERFEAGTAGAGAVSLSGTVGELSIDSAGAGEIDASALSAKRVTVTIAGAGSVDVNAEETLKVSITVAGEVTSTGGATVDQTIIGVGTIRKKR